MIEMCLWGKAVWQGYTERVSYNDRDEFFG